MSDMLDKLQNTIKKLNEAGREARSIMNLEKTKIY